MTSILRFGERADREGELPGSVCLSSAERIASISKTCQSRLIVRGAGPGSIVLLHDGDGYDPHGDRMQTARALPLIIHGLREHGYSFVSLSAP